MYGSSAWIRQDSAVLLATYLQAEIVPVMEVAIEAVVAVAC